MPDRYAMKPVRMNHHRQGGAFLIEVLVAMLLLSFGMLSLGSMLSVAVQAPKLSGYRAAAVNLASSHIGRMQANPNGFDAYILPLSETAWSFTELESDACTYPACDESDLARMDDAATRQAVRRQLPAGDLLVTCSPKACGPGAVANLWVVWQEPASSAAINLSSADHCPEEVTKIYTDPLPRCFYVRFQVEK